MSPHHNGASGFKAILFDWGGVLEVLPDSSAFSTWEGRLGLPAGSLEEILWGSVWQEVEVGALSREVYEAHVCSRCGFADHTALQAFYHEFYPRRVEPTMVAAVRALRPRYRIALVTNAWTNQRAHIEALIGGPITDVVDDYVNSAEVGVRKPEPAIFQLTLARAGAAPDEAIFVDDNAHNVAAATRLGLYAIHHQSVPRTLAALEAALGHPVLGSQLSGVRDQG